MRVYYQSWGIRGALAVGEYAVDKGEGGGPLGAVRSSLERRNDLSVCGCSPQGTSLSDGEPESRHFQITLGRPLPRKVGGGYSVEGSVWVAIPERYWTTKQEDE